MTKSVLTPSIKEPASLLKKRIGSLSLNPADNQRNDENAKAEEAPITFQSMKKPKARMRSALSSKNPNII